MCDLEGSVEGSIGGWDDVEEDVKLLVPFVCEEDVEEEDDWCAVEVEAEAKDDAAS